MFLINEHFAKVSYIVITLTHLKYAYYDKTMHIFLVCNKRHTKKANNET